jgi:hypothetical protein
MAHLLGGGAQAVFEAAAASRRTQVEIGIGDIGDLVAGFVLAIGDLGVGRGGGGTGDAQAGEEQGTGSADQVAREVLG